jgi:hypothetical protein
MLVDCIEENISLSRLVSTLTEMVNAVNESPASELVGHCPQPGETRWLSRIEGIDWLLSHEESLKRLCTREDIEVEPRQRTNFQRDFQFARFEELRVLAQIIYPFYAITLAFESDTATQSLIIPCIEQLKEYFRQQSSELVFADYPGLHDSIINCINARMSQTFDYQLLCAATLISLEGRAWFLTHIYDGDDAAAYKRWEEFCPPKIEFQYKTQYRHPIFQARQQDNEEIDPDVDPILAAANMAMQETEEEDDNDDEENLDVPIPPGSMATIYDSALNAIASIAESLEAPTKELAASFSAYLFDSSIDEHIWLHRNAAFADLWKTLSIRKGMKDFTRVCGRIIGVPASECPVERSFSLDKIILSRLRNRMSTPLLNCRARIQRKYSPKE